ncbi:MAG: amidase [Pseudomonadota bacterium]
MAGRDREAGSEDTAMARINAALDLIEARDAALRAFVALDRAGARARARALDADPIEARGPLYGLPFGVKEIIDRAGRPAGWGSATQAGRIASATAPCVARLEAAGAVAIGETVSTEFALGAAGPTRNPHDAARTPGGSSSGSAAAVGAGLTPFALATQTLGSIIRPAAYCGVVGYKPQRARIDRRGVMPLSSRLDTVGVIAASVSLAQAAVEAMSRPIAAAPLAAIMRLEPWFDAPLEPGMAAAVDAAAERLAAAGPPLTAFTAPNAVAGEPAATHAILAHDVARGHGALLEAERDAISPAFRSVLEQGLAVSDETYREALCAAEAIQAALAAAVPPGAVILAPAALGAAPPFGPSTGDRRPQQLWTLIDWPAVSVPALWRDGCPYGVQLIARPGEDAAALEAAALASNLR